jgi:hypothetical protein
MEIEPDLPVKQVNPYRRMILLAALLLTGRT